MRKRTQPHQPVKAGARSITLGVAALAALSLGTGAARAAVVPELSTALPNGVTLIARRDVLAPRIALSLLVRAGAGDETADSAGWRRLLTDAMLRASLENKSAAATEPKPTADAPPTETPPVASAAAPKARSMEELQREAEKWGGRLGASVGDDYVEFWAVGDSAGSDQLLELLLGLAMRPRLGDEEIDAARRRMLSRLEVANENIALKATNALATQLYRDGRGEPVAYGLPTNGTFKSLTNLTSDKVRKLYQHYFAPSRLIVAAAGDVHFDRLRGVLGKPDQSANWSQAGKPIIHAKAPSFVAPDKTQPPLTVRQMNTPTAWVFVAYSTAGTNAGDYVALRVLAAAMGEASKSRLPTRLMGSRDNRLVGRSGTESATTQVAVQLTPRRFAGELIFFAQTSPQSVDSVKNAMLDEVRKLKEQPLSRVELESARNFVRGNWAVERESLRERALQTGLSSVSNAPADTTWPARVAAVTAADIQRVAKKYLDNYAVALIMPQE